MAWLIDSTRIFVQKLNDTDPQTIARLNPLGGGTTLHTFGYEDEITKVAGIFVGLTDRAALKAMAKDDTFHTLSTPYGDWGDFKVKDYSDNLTYSICQTLRIDLPDDSPVFEFELTLYPDE
jgi:hypothetical protein